MAASEPQGIWTHRLVLWAPPSPSCLGDVKEMKLWTGLRLIHLSPGAPSSLGLCLPVPFMTVSRGQLI